MKGGFPVTTPIVALIYDFDKTLSPRDMEEYTFIPGIGMTPEEFWGQCNVFSRRHQMDGILTYMYLMQKLSRGRLELTREAMHRLGEAVEFFPGVEGWFDRINRIGRLNGVIVEHYIISSGLQEISYKLYVFLPYTKHLIKIVPNSRTIFRQIAE